MNQFSEEPHCYVRVISRKSKEGSFVTKGLEKVEQELLAAENDGVVSSGFRKVLTSFLHTAEAEVRSLINLYTEVDLVRAVGAFMLGDV
ncbi:formin-like protein 3 [Salvia miltiorrhiza]|uniref:formin-like protein 3 n=1 Tax=Salvia miltiorrhiza TaxID=226208 RepID=UPI0025ABAECF|nr:formin-like protein 3 [Salvia miltiorrhiza]